MAADQALLAAYRGAQQAGVPQSDPMADAFAEMQESLSKIYLKKVNKCIFEHFIHNTYFFVLCWMLRSCIQ